MDLSAEPQPAAEAERFQLKLPMPTETLPRRQFTVGTLPAQAVQVAAVQAAHKGKDNGKSFGHR